MKIVALVVCISRVVKMKDHVPFCRELNILFMVDKVVVDHVVKL